MIIIVGTPRSFTSLTSGIFRDHGVWFGRCKEYHEYCPTGSCENMEVKKILKNYKKGAVAKGNIVEPIPDFMNLVKDIMEKENYNGGPYAFKHSAVFYKQWPDEAKFICCRRPKEAVVASGKRTGMYAANPESWDVHQQIMDDLVKSGKGVNVYGEEYFKGEWSQLKDAFSFCELDFDQAIAESLLDHKYKHF